MLSYPKYTPRFPKKMWTLPRLLEHQAQHIPDRPFLQWTGEGRCHSFSEVNREVNRLAHGMRNLGIGKGDRVVIFMPNCVEYLIAWFAINKLGAVEVPINIAYKGGFLEHQVNASTAKVILLAEELVETLQASERNIPAVEQIILWSRAGEVSQPLPAFERCKVLPFADVFEDDISNPVAEVFPHDLAAILFTSGTTGLSKGVMMPHAQLYFFSEQDIQLVQLTDEDTYVTALPLFHSNAQFLTVYPCLIVGARCVLYERFSASAWVHRLHASKATVTNSLGVMMPFVLAQPPLVYDKTHKLRCLFSVPTPFDMVPAFKERFGVEQIVEAFGQTEICLPLLTPFGAERPKGSCGVLLEQWYEARLVNPETDEDVPEGEIGELLIRHKEPWTLNIGYAGMPDKTAEAYRNLWFHSGDAMRRDLVGWYYFVDRIKDSLRVRGENISSFEVEAPIWDHPSVADVAVVSVRADLEGSEDEVKACIVLKPGFSLTPTELIVWCEQRMPYFAVPRYIEFLDCFPKTPTEKVQKNKLRERGVTVDTWDRIKAGYRLREEIRKNELKQTREDAVRGT